jgi:hypothetical protein
MSNKPEVLLWLSDQRGVYIPRDFALSFHHRDVNVKGVSDEDWLILEAGPDHEAYWDTWLDVTEKAMVVTDQGVRYVLWQDGDLWFVPVGMEWDDETETYKWPPDDDTNVIQFSKEQP